MISPKLGATTRLNDVMELEEWAILDQCPCTNMKKDFVKKWTKENFKLVVIYSPTLPYITTLAKGWLVWVFKTVAEVN